MSPQAARKKFTRDEFYHLVDTGFFEGQRFELIHGDIIDKMGQKPPHSDGIQAVMDLLTQRIPIGRIRCQLPFEVDRFNEPEPDVAVTIEPIRKRHPRTADMALVIEVADASLRYDTTTKRDLYATAGVSEYWVVDIPNARVHVHRKPKGDQFEEVTIADINGSIAFEGVQFPVAGMLPAA